MIRILELIAFLGEVTANEIKSFSKSPSYAEKLITLLKREEKKLADILFLFHRADVKIFPDEKQLLKNTSVNTCADPTDNTDEQRPEFYTSVYEKLEQEDTKLWHLSPLTLYNMFEEEQKTGDFVFPEEA